MKIKLILVGLSLMGASLSAQTPGITLTLESQGNTSWNLQADFTLPPGYHQTLQKDFFFLQLDSSLGKEGVISGALAYPATDQKILGVPSYEGMVSISLPVSEGANFSSTDLVGSLGWQICDDDGVCLLPETRTFTLSIPKTGDPPSTLVLSKLIEASTTPQPWGGLGTSTLAGNDENPSSLSTPLPLNGIEPRLPAPTNPDFLTLIIIILSAFAGGLILNLMPCVLPVLSIKVLSLVKQAGGDNRSRWLHTWATVGGILLSLVALALVLILVQASGRAVGWGFQFQNPWYVVALFTMILIFAFSLFDVFIISTPALRPGKIQGLGGSFFTGFLTVILATPCTAPFLGTALGLAFTSPWWVILLTFTAIGIGLALPFFLLALVPGAFKFLPRPGAWMDTFKGVMAFGLLGTDLWLLSVLLKQTSTQGFIGILWFIGLIALASWLLGVLQRSTWNGLKRKISLTLLLLGTLGGGWALLDHLDSPPNESTQKPSGDPWTTFSPDAIANALENGRTVFLDFTADWCLTCQVNEAGALRDPRFLEKIKAKNILLVRGDYTRADPIITNWLQKYQRAGVPFYGIFRPDQTVEILPELLSSEILLERL